MPGVYHSWVISNEDQPQGSPGIMWLTPELYCPVFTSISPLPMADHVRKWNWRDTLIQQRGQYTSNGVQPCYMV